MSKRVQFTSVNFPDLNPNSYDNINNIKLDLNVSSKVKFSANAHGLKFKNQANCRFLLRVLLCIFKRALIGSFAEMKVFARVL